MRTIEPWKTWTFIGTLVVIAVLVNAGFDLLHRVSNPEPSSARYPEPSRPTYTPSPPVAERTSPAPERTVESPPQKTPEELAAERARFLARYMNARPSRSPGIETVAVVAVNEHGTLNGALATVLAEHVKGEAVKTHTSMFTPEFVSDGLFQDGFNDSSVPVSKLELGEVLDAFLLARQSVVYSTNASLENVLTATMQLEVVRVPIAKRGDRRSWTFNANGAGFKPADARKAAEERIVKQLSADTNIVISTSR